MATSHHRTSISYNSNLGGTSQVYSPKPDDSTNHFQTVSHNDTLTACMSWTVHWSVTTIISSLQRYHQLIQVHTHDCILLRDIRQVLEHTQLIPCKLDDTRVPLVEDVDFAVTHFRQKEERIIKHEDFGDRQGDCGHTFDFIAVSVGLLFFILIQNGYFYHLQL